MTVELRTGASQPQMRPLSLGMLHTRQYHPPLNEAISSSSFLTSLSEFAYCLISSTRDNFSWAKRLTWSRSSSSSNSWSNVLEKPPLNVCSINFRRKRSNYKREHGILSYQVTFQSACKQQVQINLVPGNSVPYGQHQEIYTTVFAIRWPKTRMRSWDEMESLL